MAARPTSWYERDDLVRYLWIFDGHNLIFARRDWERLQTSGRPRAARKRLETALTRFGRAVGTQVWIIYDGNRSEGNPRTIETPFLRATFTVGLQEADDRIQEVARDALTRGERPVVVSSDRRTLLDALDTGVRRLEVQPFFERVYDRLLRAPEKWVPDGLEDVEQHFLRSEDDPDRTESG